MNEDISINVIPVTSLKSGGISYKLKRRDAVQMPIEEIRAEDGKASEGKMYPTLYPPLPTSGLEPNINQAHGLHPILYPEVVKKLFNNEITFSEPENQSNSELGKVLFEKGFSRLFFKVLDMKASKKFGKPCFYVLECYDVSAADLKVASKFGSWDSLSCRLLIECRTPVVLWTETITPCKEIEKTNSEKETHSACPYTSKQLSGYMVKATIPLEHATALRDMLYSMKLARKEEIKKIKELKKQGHLDRKVATPSKIREGLPEWVNYVPYQWYSKGFRVTLEYILVSYTILSLLWAIWQLYKHVDFIRDYLKPIMEVFEYYFFIMKDWFYWFDKVVIAASHYWWSYLKPTFMLIFAAIAPLAQVFKPLRRLIDALPVILAPFIQCLLLVYAFLKPIVLPLVGSCRFLSQVLYQVFAYIAQGFNIFKNSSAVAYVIERGSQLTVVKTIHSALHGKLDPLKAQFMVVRGLIFQSARKVFFGIKFLMGRIYHVIIFIRRERQYGIKNTKPKDADNDVVDAVDKAKVN